MNCGFGGKIKTQSFQKLFSGGHLFVFVEYLCNRSPKIKTKNIKNYSSILAIVNHRNWPDDSPPLTYLKDLVFKGGESSSQFRWFTIAKIEQYFLIFFALILGLRLQRYSTNAKRYPPKKVFGNS